ncbi:MAG TPA: hypothetical protein DIU39_09675, partial [Flavobacteriales bacterium]|nr:hypothetical protein [Flavobacteriales bacterium]
MEAKKLRPLVSVICLVYNHEKFIEKCLSSIYNQKTNFNFNVFILDDSSVDNSKQVVESFIKPSKKCEFIYIRHVKNIGMQANFLYGLKNANGKYIALLDGDDYWIDEYKLQKQITYLENNPKSAGCFHDVITVDENHEVISEKYFIPQRNKYNFIQNLKELKSSYATCSLVFRRKVLVNMPNWYKNIPCDFTTDILITQFGTLDYLPETMAAYRIHKGGVWQGSQKEKHFAEMAYRYLILLKSGQFKQQKSIILNEYLTAQRKLVAFQMKKSEKLKTIKKV